MIGRPHPNEVLEQLLASTHRPERQATLRGLHKVCAAQAAGSSNTFDVRTIGTIAEALGVLKKKTLSNKSSADLVTLIKSWAAYAGREAAPASDPTRSAITDKLLTIQDPALRALIQTRLAERDRLISQVNLLKAATTLVIDRRPSSSVVTSGPTEALPLQLLPSELSALRQVLSPEFLFDEGWREGADGEVCDLETGRRVFPKAFLTALRRIVDSR